MTEARNFWVDGEKIPDARLNQVFQTPPDAASPFLRSALVIGARGAGKTTLFRYLKESHSGIGIHLSLAAELGCIQKETGFGSLAKDCPTHLQSLLPGKTISLLAVAIAERVTRKGVMAKSEPLLACLPSQLAIPVSQELTLADLVALKARIVDTEVRAFGGLANGRPLTDFLGALGKDCDRTRGPLLVLLDRADMVNAQCLLPIFELLDQSSDYTALVAMRPGHTNDAIEDIARQVVPGDHYDVVHLGHQPRSAAWHKFVEESARAQAGVLGFREQFDNVPSDVKSWITAVARDSVRTALELHARYLNAKPGTGERELVEAIDDAREGLLIATVPCLHKFNSDFRGFTNEVRAEVIKEAGHCACPVYVTFKQKPKDDLFSDSSAWLNRFIQEALRCGAFSMPVGQRWIPGLRPNVIEVSPLLIWHKDNPKWEINSEATEVTKDETELRGSYGASKKPATIFVAFRMRSVESKQFRSAIEEETRSRGDLSTLVIVDGSVPAGTAWAPEIRRRISKAKAVIGDITQLSSEVLFEMGFAYGLKKITIGAVAETNDRYKLPAWLSITQLGTYGSPADVTALVSSIAVHLRDPDLAKLPEPKQPVPELVVMLRQRKWNEQAYSQARYLVQKTGLTLVQFNLDDGTPDETVIQRAASASLLIISLDGTEPDALMHYICGAVLAKPESQVAGKKFHRRVVIVEDPSNHGRPLTADSVRRCPEAKVVGSDQVKEEVEKFIAAYEEWIRTTRKES